MARFASQNQLIDFDLIRSFDHQRTKKKMCRQNYKYHYHFYFDNGILFILTCVDSMSK